MTTKVILVGSFAHHAKAALIASLAAVQIEAAVDIELQPGESIPAPLGFDLVLSGDVTQLVALMTLHADAVAEGLALTHGAEFVHFADGKAENIRLNLVNTKRTPIRYKIGKKLAEMRFYDPVVNIEIDTPGDSPAPVAEDGGGTVDLTAATDEPEPDQRNDSVELESAGSVVIGAPPVDAVTAPKKRK